MNITIFGWKRENLTKYLKDCEEISQILAKQNNNIFTGGGGGFMLAANKGCYKFNKDLSKAISVKSIYGKEGQINKYYNNDNLIITNEMKERKYKLIIDKDLFIFFPGGVGTIDEFTDLITLYKTGELDRKPIILYGKFYWNSLKNWFYSNNIDFPNKYICGIVDDVSEFFIIYNNIFK